MSSIFGKNRDKIKEQEKLFKDTLVELEEEKQQYRKEMQKLLMKNDKLEKDNTILRDKYKALKIAYDDYRHNKSVPINSRTSGSLAIINGVIKRDNNKSPNLSSSTNGGKTKRNKYRRSKYRRSKRKY